MKKLGLAFLIFFVQKLTAQDQLYKTDNTKVLAKILEVGPTEIKYKMYSNLNGPTYVELREHVILIIYENGQHEAISQTTPAQSPTNFPTRPEKEQPRAEPVRSTGYLKGDSALYYSHTNSIHINFLNFMNNEVGLIYMKDVFKNHMNVMIPVAFGVDNPGISQTVFFESMSEQYTLDRKVFEGGIGVNYYPSFRSPVNYFIGPAFRYLLYDGTQTHHSGGKFYPSHQSQLTRMCFTITNGLVFRTKSRLLATLFGSIGFKNDYVSSKLVDPVTKAEIDPIDNPFGIYVWLGFTLGFAF